MKGDWPTVKVGLLAESVSATHPLSKDTLIFLNTSDVFFGRILHNTYSAVRDWPGQAKKSIRREDILFSEIRPANGRWAYVDVDADDFVVSTKLMVIRCRPGKIIPRYLYHFLTSAQTTRLLQFLAESRSGTFPQITFDQVAELELALPPMASQLAAAGFLDCLEAKIELNRQMNETLEGMARALFKSWFVDFDPVRAKAEGRQPGGMDAETAALFPSEFEESELGPIPKGWRVGRLGDVASTERSALNPMSYPDEVFDHFSLPAFDEGKVPKKELGSSIKSNKFRVGGSVVLFSKLNPHIPRVWLVDASDESRSVASTEFIVMRAAGTFQRSYVYLLTTSDAFSTRAASLVGGTTGSHQRIPPDALMGLKVVLPSGEVTAAFDGLVGTMLQRVFANPRESRTLAELRDTLLPKLLSGEVRVRDAVRALEALG